MHMGGNRKTHSFVEGERKRRRMRYGQDDLNLNGYMGGPISAQGDLVVNLAGENSVTNNAAPENNAGASLLIREILPSKGRAPLMPLPIPM